MLTTGEGVWCKGLRSRSQKRICSVTVQYGVRECVLAKQGRIESCRIWVKLEPEPEPELELEVEECFASLRMRVEGEMKDGGGMHVAIQVRRTSG